MCDELRLKPFGGVGIPHKMKKSLAAALLFTALAVLAHALDYPLAKPQIESNVGKAVPDFVLKDQSGKDFRLADQKGTKVLIVFYRGSWCPYCMAQLKDLAANKAKFDKLNVKIVAISADMPEMGRKVYEKAVNQQFTVLSDPELRVIKEYGLFQGKGINAVETAIRTSLLVDEKGVEVFRRVSKSAADIPSAEELLARITAGK
jgi:peroxiredoxin